MPLLNKLFDSGDRLCALVSIGLRVLASAVGFVGLITAYSTYQLSQNTGQTWPFLILAIGQFLAGNWIGYVLWVRGSEVGQRPASVVEFPILWILRCGLRIGGEAALGASFFIGLGMCGFTLITRGLTPMQLGAFSNLWVPPPIYSGFTGAFIMMLSCILVGLFYWLLLAGLGELILLLAGIHQNGKSRAA